MHPARQRKRERKREIIAMDIIRFCCDFACCMLFFQGGATLTRFQPRFGRIIAAAAGNSVSLLDVDTLVCRLKLQVSEPSFS